MMVSDSMKTIKSTPKTFTLFGMMSHVTMLCPADMLSNKKSL